MIYGGTILNNLCFLFFRGAYPLWGIGFGAATFAQIAETLPAKPIYMVDTVGLSPEGGALEMVAGALGRNFHYYDTTPVFPLTDDDMYDGRGFGITVPMIQLGKPSMMAANPKKYAPELRTEDGRLTFLSGGTDPKHKLHHDIVNIIGMPMPWLGQKQVTGDTGGWDKRHYAKPSDEAMKFMTSCYGSRHFLQSAEDRASFAGYTYGILADDAARYARDVGRLKAALPALLKKHGVADVDEVMKRLDKIWPAAVSDAEKTVDSARKKSDTLMATRIGGATYKDYAPFTKKKRPEFYATGGNDRTRYVFAHPTDYVKGIVTDVPETDEWTRPKPTGKQIYSPHDMVFVTNTCSMTSKQKVTPTSGHAPRFNGDKMTDTGELSRPMPAGYQAKFKDYRKNPPQGEDKPIGDTVVSGKDEQAKKTPTRPVRRVKN